MVCAGAADIQPDQEHDQQEEDGATFAVAALTRARVVDDARNESDATGRSACENRARRKADFASHYCANMTGVMALVKVTRDDPSLLHEQVAAQIRRAIAEGEARPGERLPPARHLNTVLRALRQLRDEGLLELVQGRGSRVTGTPERSAVLTQVAELVALAQRNGYTRAQLARLIQSAH